MTAAPVFDLLEPETVEEAVALHGARHDAHYVAGGTDVIPSMRRGLETPARLIHLAAIPELGILESGEDGLVIGAGVTLAALEEVHETLAPYPALRTAVDAVAAPGHRMFATVGGNLCLDTRCVYYNQSQWWRAANRYCLKRGDGVCHVAPESNRCRAAFSGDLAPALMVLDAEIEIAGEGGRRRQPLSALYRDDGRAHLTLAPGEIVVSVHIPKKSANLRSGYLKSRVRRSLDFPLAGVAAALLREGDEIHALRIALTGLDSRPVQLDGLESLTGKPLGPETLKAIASNVARAVKPMRTTLAPAHYRRHVAGILAQRLVTRLYEDGDATPIRNLGA